jgi:octaheme c-type cytochrome (tetrathionate reductase family)
MNIASNEARCTSCHAGYGWDDKNFDFSREEKVDCLVCHDQSLEYKKYPTDAGYPPFEDKYFDGELYKKVDLKKTAQSVGMPQRHNCGACHFYGGGGDGVKHGDLDSSLIDPPYELDVHMSKDGGNFSCARCHTTVEHKIAGRCYKTPAFTDRKSVLDSDMVKRISCVSCHTETPHKENKKLNDHTDKVSCQACHIPAFARQNPTKMYWDWSTGGKLKDGKPYITMDEEMDRIKYMSKKGDFTWEKNVEPEYFWFNGSMEYTLLTDKIDPSHPPVKLNRVMGDMNDEKSRIYPFKVHRAKQPYDKGNNTMAAVHLFGKDKTSYWKNFHWGNAIEAAMDYMKLPYSGEYDFIETEYHFPTTHMVAPAKNALNCSSCHSKEGRLKNLAGFYMPGRDSLGFIDKTGFTLIILSLCTVFVHGLIRIFSSSKKE